MTTVRPILISGAGISGLLLARSLENTRIPFLLYERDASIKARAQGYRLRISGDGITALKEVLSPEEYAKLESGTIQTAQGGVHSIDAITGEEQPSDELESASTNGPKLGKGVLGISRSYLRERLFEGKENVVNWGKQAVGYTLTTSGVVLKFADGTSSPEGSLLVAADGPHSAITKQLTDGKVRSYDTGARLIHGQTTSRAFKELGYGVWGASDESRSEGTVYLITNVRPGALDEEVELGWNLGGSPGTFSAPGENYSIVGKVAADLSRDLTAKWHPSVRAVFEQQNDEEAAFLKMSTAHPDGIPEWPNSPRVTIMGDAVHTMTPAGGVGANTAMRDAALIARLLKEAGGWREDITKTYEDEMRVYASAAVKMSFESASGRFGFDVSTIK